MTQWTRMPIKKYIDHFGTKHSAMINKMIRSLSNSKINDCIQTLEPVTNRSAFALLPNKSMQNTDIELARSMQYFKVIFHLITGLWTVCLWPRATCCEREIRESNQKTMVNFSGQTRGIRLADSRIEHIWTQCTFSVCSVGIVQCHVLPGKHLQCQYEQNNGIRFRIDVKWKMQSSSWMALMMTMTTTFSDTHFKW